MFSLAFRVSRVSRVSTIGGGEGEVAHNLICQHSAIVLPVGTDVRRLRQTPRVSHLSPFDGRGVLAPALMPAPLPSWRGGNALIRRLHAHNTSE